MTLWNKIPTCKMLKKNAYLMWQYIYSAILGGKPLFQNNSYMVKNEVYIAYLVVVCVQCLKECNPNPGQTNHKQKEMVSLHFIVYHLNCITFLQTPVIDQPQWKADMVYISFFIINWCLSVLLSFGKGCTSKICTLCTVILNKHSF